MEFTEAPETKRRHVAEARYCDVDGSVKEGGELSSGFTGKRLRVPVRSIRASYKLSGLRVCRHR